MMVVLLILGSSKTWA